MKSKTSIKELIIRVILLMVGLVIAHLGVTLFLRANLGADPFNVFVQGVFHALQSRFSDFALLSHGNTHVVISILIIIILLVVDRSYVKIGTLLCMICGGPIIDIFDRLLKFLINDTNPFWYKLIFNALGCVILAFGMSIVIRSEAGTGPNDLVAVVISDKLKKKFSITRVVVDIVFVIIGYLLGGTVGVGTIVCAALVGPVAGIVMPFSQKIVNSVLKMCKVEIHAD